VTVWDVTAWQGDAFLVLPFLKGHPGGISFASAPEHILFCQVFFQGRKESH
jgi:hypothetical protein